jgi:hypothetical protein
VTTGDGRGVLEGGRLPLRLRVGTTGHRSLSDPARVRAGIVEAVRAVVTAVQERSAGLVSLCVVSSLAQGADQLLADAVLEWADADLEVILPFDIDRYAATMSPDAAVGLRTLADRASRVRTLSGERPDEYAYELAGRSVVERSDVLIAVWDSEPARGRGGTQEIVEFARRGRGHQYNVPVVVVSPDGRVEMPTDLADTLNDRVLGLMNQFNRPRLRDSVVRFTSYAGGDVTDSDVASIAALEAWVGPCFARADTLAVRAQRAFRVASVGILVFAAVALTLAGYSAAFAKGNRAAVAGELAALIVALALFVAARHFQWNRLWTTNRFLAERLRSSFYLACAGRHDWHAGDLWSVSDKTPASWVARCTDELWRYRPTVTPITLPVAAQIVNRGWIAGQIRYHHQRAERDELLETAIHALVIFFLVGAIVVAGVHFTGLVDEGFWEHMLIFLSLAFPAFGGALTGLAAQREYGRGADRHQRISEQLRQISERLRATPTEAVFQRLALAAEEAMTHETREWFGSLQFHDVEPHV